MYSESLFVGLIMTILISVDGTTQSPKCSYSKRDSSFSFHPLSEIPNSKPEGFYAVVKVAIESDFGHIHILLSESDDDKNNNNQGYEFALSPWEDSEVRLRNKVHGKYEILAKNEYKVKEYAPNITHIEISVSTDGVVKLLDLNSNASFNFTHSSPFPINFISFSGHSELEYNCDYGVFRDDTLFIQARCETIYGWHTKLFNPLDTVITSSPPGYYAKLNISMLSDYGDVHIILSENEEKDSANPCYEYVIGDRFSTQSEIRRKNSITEAYDFVSQKSFPYKITSRRSHLWMEISVSNDGVVTFVDLWNKVELKFEDSQTTIPVKYITFGGYRNYPATYQIDCVKSATKCF